MEKCQINSWKTTSFLFGLEMNLSIYSVCNKRYIVDNKYKSQLWPFRHTTEKIKFLSKVIQIFGPETFGLVIVRKTCNFCCMIFKIQTAAGNWVCSSGMGRLRVPTASSWAVQEIWDFWKHKKHRDYLLISCFDDGSRNLKSLG